MKKNIVLYSEKNFVWTSMQEIIPRLVECWKLAGNILDYETVIIDVDKDSSIKSHLNDIINSENIILSCFNADIARYARMIREELGVDSRFLIHLHGLASVGCWPVHEFKLGEVLRRKDVFFSSCTRDSETFGLSFEDPIVEVIPFSHSLIKDRVEKKITPCPTLVYVGRLAEQKNLHQLLWAISIIKKEKRAQDFKLRIFGAPDDLGSPNMDIDFPEYEKFLKQLKSKLLLENVSFEGFVVREDLDRWIVENDHVFISPSLHSDENFGMAALKSLQSGREAILSDWGGHFDFKSSFSKQVSLLPVYSGDYGPCLDPFELVQTIVEKLENHSCNHKPSQKYEKSFVVSMYKKFLEKSGSISNEKLEPTELALKVHESRNRLLGKKRCQIFKGYNDPLATPFFKGYGMSGNRIERGSAKGEKAPWVGSPEFVDPHKGNIENQNNDEKRLLENGWLY